MKTPHYEVEAYTDEEVKKIEDTFLHTKIYMPNIGGQFIRKRDLYIFKLALALGLRPTQVISMTWWNIDWEKHEINLNPYTNKERSTTPIILNEKAKGLLMAWRELCHQFIHCDFIFPCLTTFEPVTADAYRKRLGRIMDECKVRKILWYTEAGQPIYNKRLYSTRKTFGTNLWNNSGGDTELLRMALTHKSSNHLGPYTKPTNTMLKEKLDRFV